MKKLTIAEAAQSVATTPIYFNLPVVYSKILVNA
jgi:hypothetical protein